MSIKYFLYKLFSKHELIGIWTREDDESGLLNIFGWSLEFTDKNNLIYYF